MINELKRPYFLAVKVILLLSVVCLFIDFRYSLSMILGLMASGVHLLNLQSNMTGLLKSRSKNRFKRFLKYMMNFMILLIPFLIAAAFPNFFNFIFIFVGEIMDKAAIYFIYLKERG